MKNAMVNARAIVRKEQDDFFKSLSAAAPVDALTVLKDVQGAVSQLVSGGKLPDVLTKQLEAAEKEQKDSYKSLMDQRRKVASLEAEVAAVQERIQKRKYELAGAVTEERKAEVNSALAKLRDERDKKEAELVAAKGALAALTGS